MLLTRVRHGAKAMTAAQALCLATLGGAECLGRDDIGTVASGKSADLALFDLEEIGFSGSWDPVGALLFCQPAGVRMLIVNGRIVVRDGHLLTMDLPEIQRRHRQIASRLATPCH